MTKVRVNKSDAIRSLARSGVTDAASIVSQLAKNDIKVAPSQVYSVLSSMRHKRAKGKRIAKRSKLTVVDPLVQRQPTIIEVAGNFITASGGLSEAIEVLEQLKLFRDGVNSF